MKPRSFKLLDDIRVACDHIVETIATAPLAEYLSNYHLRNDIERELTRLGEATILLLKEDPSYETRISSVPNIVGMRHHLVHGYEHIKNEVVWETARNHIPQLRREDVALIEEHVSRLPSKQPGSKS